MKKNILIAAKTEKICTLYKEMLAEEEYNVTMMTEAGSIRFLNLEKYSAVIISLPLSDESGVKLIGELNEKYQIPIGAVVKADISDAVLGKLVDENAYILRKPVSHSNFMLAADLLSSFSRNNANLRERIAELERRNNEIKLMSRAKLLLIREKGMSEDQAHKYILRQAMNNQTSIDKVCREIIDNSGQR